MTKIATSQPPDLKSIKIDDPFWNQRIKLMVEKVIPYQWDALNDNIPGIPPSHAVENFRIAAGLSDGEFKGMVFQDSDVAKWIEAASYSLALQPDSRLEQLVDEVTDIIAKAQQENGYLNTYFTMAKPDQQWKDFSHGHELYCAGHMMEAAVAYYEATGKDKLLSVVSEFADYIDQLMGPEADKWKTYPGHPEIEMALIRLYEATNEERYLKLSEYFVNERGRQPSFLKDEPTFAFGKGDEWFQLDYHQAHAPAREQETAEGHSVRAMYLYSGMADIARETGDESLLKSLQILWENVVNRRMYITGGLGSQGHGEKFTLDYDLPNDVAYAETCASIGLIFWARRMLQLEPDRKYADVMEKALYNGVLSGMSLDGEKYFYVNPLEVQPEEARHRHDHAHVEPERVGWFGCACCPPNIARLITSLGEYIYTQAEEKIYVQLYIGNETSFQVKGKTVKISQQSDYPSDGNVSIQVDPNAAVDLDLFLRIPAWCDNYQVKVNGETAHSSVLHNGYLKLSRTWEKGDKVELFLDVRVKKMHAHPKVRENAGKIAIQRGPLVYCLEEADNGADLAALSIPENAVLVPDKGETLWPGIVTLTGEANRLVSHSSSELYREAGWEKEKVSVRAIPYSYWGNRKAGEMIVWVREE